MAAHVRPLFVALMLVPTAVLAQEPTYCGHLRAQHANMPEATRPTFDEWITANWPGGRFNLCIGKPVPPGVQAGFPQRGGGQPVLTTCEQRYCYTIAITHGHMRPSAAKDADGAALWIRMRCSAFLERPLPGGPLPPEEEARYQAALNRLPPS